jgi:NAD(P)-dependent dehydrogenase (short-subunit alcohol dehydrogenase family)
MDRDRTYGYRGLRAERKGWGMKDFSARVVVVTGAASGIGREIAHAFARRGAILALADISATGLHEVGDEMGQYGSIAYTRKVDVSRAEEVSDFCDNVYREMGRVDVLCNNAGVAVSGEFEDISLEDWEWILGVNIWGVIHGCHCFYPRMIAQDGGGHIVNIASAAGLIPVPGAIPYVTTKHGVVGLSEALRAEAALHGVGVSAVCPGFVLTGIYRDARQCTPPVKGTREDFVADTERRLSRRRYSAASVAEAVVAAVERNRGVVRLCPESYAGDILYRLSRRTYGLLMARVAANGKRVAATASLD